MRRQLHVTGMKCETCVSSVKQALEEVPGVREAQVNLEDGQAVIEEGSEHVRPQALIEAVQNAGFDAHPDERTQ
jgi:copper chaperone CopZ